MAQSIGLRIKALRAEQKLTLSELAERVGLSTSYLSQVERDKTTPSLAALTAIAAALQVQVRHFFETAAEAAYVVRSADRNGAGNQLDAAADLGDVREEQLVPPGRGRLAVCRLQFPPGRASGALPTTPGEEFVFVLSGVISMDVGGESFSLGAGDSLHYDAAQPHAWHNDSAAACTVIWGSAAGSPEL